MCRCAKVLLRYIFECLWGRQVPGGPHFGPLNFVIWDMKGCDVAWEPRHYLKQATTEFFIWYHVVLLGSDDITPKQLGNEYGVVQMSE